MAGTINLALSQQFDMDGEPLSGGFLFFFAAGTTTPQSAFQDQLLSIVFPNPIVLDASGRVPMFYLADGNIKIRLTDKSGVVVIAADNLLVIGPSAGGGGGGGVDPATVLATGDVKCRYGIGPLDGFVRCNGSTIGATGSSAVELAGPKAQALYEYLWPFPNIALDGVAKGANAVADFNALKRMVLPDIRGRVIAGMDDMGNTAAGRLTAAFFGQLGTVVGNVGGSEKVQLGMLNLPSGGVTITFPSAAKAVPFAPATIGITVTGSLAAPVITTAVRDASSPGGGGSSSTAVEGAAQTNSSNTIATAPAIGFGTAQWSFNQSALAGTFNQNILTASGTISGAVSATLGNAFSTMAPAMVLTIYLKL
jgi:hypothetical protein